MTLAATLAAVTEEEIIATDGAQSAVIDSIGRQAAINKLLRICAIDIQIPFAIRLPL
jgi:hypothetical protein